MTEGNFYLSGVQIVRNGSHSTRPHDFGPHYFDTTTTPQDLVKSAREQLVRMHQREAIRAAESIMQYGDGKDLHKYMAAVRTIALIMLLRGHDDNWLDMALRAANAGNFRSDGYIDHAIERIGTHRERWAAIAASDPGFALALAAELYPGQAPADATKMGA